MFVIILFGIGMIFFGFLMVISPLKFSTGIVTFSQKPWFHMFEILSRLVVGIVFLVFADKTPYALVAEVIGGLLCFTSMFLIIIGAKRHKKIAMLTSRIGKHFRILGVFAILCGIGITYFGLT